jgi:hypothetical protein
VVKVLPIFTTLLGKSVAKNYPVYFYAADVHLLHKNIHLIYQKQLKHINTT